MIFVTVGTSQHRFDRLVLAADRIAAADEPVIVQRGTSRVPCRHATFLDYLPFADLDQYVRSSRVVVSHAGVGSVALCLRNGRRPIVVPRDPAFGEMIDDHQLSFALRLAELDLITLVDDVADLPAAVSAPRSAPPKTGLSSALADELVRYISRYAAVAPTLSDSADV
jgi:UDP-N-acetylglucosamine transferase subunit ALG13